MDLHSIITTLLPINKKEKVDTLIQMIGANGIRMDRNVDLSIRYAIQKLSIQNYYIESYGNLWKEQTKAQEHHVNEVKQAPQRLNMKEEYLREAEKERRRLVAEQQRKVEMEKERKRKNAEEKMLRELEEKKQREAVAEAFLNSIGEKKMKHRQTIDELITKELKGDRGESQMESPIMATFGAAYKEERKRKRDAFKRMQKPCGNNIATTTKNSVKPIYIPSGGMNKKY